MPRPSFFDATPFLLLATLILVATTFSGLQVFVSRPDYLSFYRILCCDHNSMSRHTISIVIQFDPWSQPTFHVPTSFLAFYLHASCDSNCRSVYFLVIIWELGRDKVVSFLNAISVATSKACRGRSFFQSCRNLIF